MSESASNRYNKLINLLIAKRKAERINQKDLGISVGLDQSSVSRYESRELRMDIQLLSQWCDALGQDLRHLLELAGFLLPTRIVAEDAEDYSVTQRANTVAVPSGAIGSSDGFDLLLKWGAREYRIPFPRSRVEVYRKLSKEIEERFASLNKGRPRQSNRDAIADAIEIAMREMPEANPSDVYHHIIYRTYLSKYRRTDPSQSWVRAGGEALELFFKRHYAPLLSQAGITVEIAYECKERNKFIIAMGLADQIAGKSKLDICLYGKTSKGTVAFAGVHSKASLAERVSDDKPCSERMIAAGFKSYLFTMDVKSYPPPDGDLINYGELGSLSRPSDKRGYIEMHGSFDACFSYNTRTMPSGIRTDSGKKIFASRFDSSDQLVPVVINDWRLWKEERGL